MTTTTRLTVLFATFFSTAALAEKYAFVDLSRAMEETDDGKKAKTRLKADFDRKQKELDDKQEELKKKKEAFDKKKAIMKQEALAAEEKDLQERFLELQATYARLQKDLATKEAEATRPILTKLQAVVGKIAEREKFSMVVEKSALIWGQASLDITNEVIRNYNADSGTKK